MLARRVAGPLSLIDVMNMRLGPADTRLRVRHPLRLSFSMVTVPRVGALPQARIRLLFPFLGPFPILNLLQRGKDNARQPEAIENVRGFAVHAEDVKAEIPAVLCE